MTERSSSEKGIDIRKAFEILTERTTTASSSSHPHGAAPSPDKPEEEKACGCCHASSKDAPPNATQMGQTIDLTGVLPKNLTAELSEEEAALQKRVLQERWQRQTELKKRLHSMQLEELLRTVLEAQEQRVLAYRDYDHGLEQVLQTGNMTKYPSLCAEATAAFSVLSETIKAVHGILLDQHKRKDLANFIAQLQSKEKEKLNLTAALHLERIRERNATFDEEATNNADSAKKNTNSKIVSLMKQDVDSLRKRVASCVEEINEVLEELRCSIVEEQE